MIHIVEKVIADEDMESFMNTYIKREQIHTIIEDDADVYNHAGDLLLRFRKNKIDKELNESFFTNIVSFASRKTSNRGGTSGNNERKTIWTNQPTMTNIFGFFGNFSPSQKVKMRKLTEPVIKARECRFNRDYPEKYKACLPLIQEIDKLYRKLVPLRYDLQRNKADETEYRIADTAFTTVTTNINFQTTVHKDRGDDDEGFGNLTVIEDGEYEGAETCLLQYGIGVNVRQGDILFMDVHQAHGNLPMIKKDESVRRLSVVCYLRKDVWSRTKGLSMEAQTKILREL
jgi:hypothetical protein